MRDQAWSNLVAVVAIAAVVVALPVLFLVVPGPAAPAQGASSASMPTVFTNLSIVRGPSGEYMYNETALSVPSDVRVVFTITNYDPARSILPRSSDAQVVGTINGTMTVASGGRVSTVTAVATNDVAHTFTMSDAYYHLNVPIPPASSATQPTTVTFAVVFSTSGENFAWGCVVYCGGPLMAGMYGTITVR